MKKLLHILLLLALLMTVFSCKERKKPLPGEISEADLKPKNDTIVDDTILNEWGEPAPPPDVEGDGSSLFTERLSRRAGEQIVMREEEPPRDITSVRWDDTDSRADNSNDEYDSRPSSDRNRTARNDLPSKPVVWKPVNDPAFDYSSYSSSDGPIITDEGIQVLPYAANDAEKIDFIKSFYEDCFARDGRNIDETKLSVACRRFIQDKVAETGDFGAGRFFRTQIARPSKSWDDVMKNMNVKAVGEDWFKVEMDEGAGRKSFELKVVEIDGQLKIDMVKNKN